MKILLLEDDKNLSESLKLYLELESLDVTCAYSSDDIYDLTFQESFDLYLIDVNIPGDDGFEVLKNLRESGDNTPAIFITALTDINSISKGFELDVDDYIKKPFSPEEVVLRIKNKYMKDEESSLLRYKDIEFDANQKQLKKGGITISLGEVQLNILITLLKNKNKIVPLNELLDLLDNPNTNALRVNIAKIKNKLDINIKNIRTIGYILEEV
jgi:DNA-binding response OmpR family regulator